MQYHVKLVFTETYSVGPFDTQEEVDAFVQRYQYDSDRLNRDFDRLPQYASLDTKCGRADVTVTSTVVAFTHE